MEEHELAVKAGVLAETVIHKLKELSKNLVLAESCTAGLISNYLAQISGASQVFFGSYVSYTKDAKITMLGIGRELLDKYALVSRETASLMASGALEKSGVDLAAAVTGLAGPSGDGSGVKIGTVWIASASRKAGVLKTGKFQFDGSRNYIRICAAIEVLEIVKFQLENDLTKI
jgi:PncC family amidohydrolase